MIKAYALPKPLSYLIAALAIFGLLFFVTTSQIVKADDSEQATNQTTETVVDQPSDTLGLPEIITETFAPVVEEATQPVVEEPTAPVVEESVAPIEETSAVSSAPVQSPEISSDKADYYPWETVTIFGRFFEAFKNIVVRLVGGVGDTYREFAQEIQTNADGAFTFVQELDGVFRPDYTATASDENGNVLATTSFTDAFSASVDVYSQCANDAGVGPTCNWTNGNLNASNSTYQEGDATVQRLALDDLVAGDHTVTIQYDSLKSAKHAYDYITDDKFSESWVTNADFCSSPITHLASCSSLTPTYSGVIPAAANAGGFDIAAGVNRRFRIWNGSWVGSGIISGPTVVSGTDQPTNIQLKFNVNPATCANPHKTQGTDVCEVLITFGAHISRQADWGQGNSAVNISGSPYHVRVVELDGGTVGNRDNQMQAGAIPSTIIIRKVTSPSSSQSFAFTTSGTGYTAFNLSNGQNNTQLVDSGNYSVTETAVAGYTVTIQCTVSGDGTVATPNNANRSVAITIGPNGGNVVDCTYTNTLQQGNLRIVKNTVGGNDTFNYSVTGPSPSTPSVTTSGGTGQTALLPANDGTNYAITETVPSGWNFTSATCDKAFTAGANGVTGVTVVAGQTTTCTFTNTKKAFLTVNKVVNPTNDTGKFNLQIDTSTAGTGGNVGNGGTTGAVEVTAGAHTVGETAVAGTNLSDYTSVISGDCAANGSVSVAAGESKVCTITNTRKATIIVKKHMVGGTDTFNFTGTPNGSISTDNGTIQASVVPGQYTSTETAKTGWDLNSITCDNGGSTGNVGTATATFNVTAGQTVTCTFTNTKRGHIIVDKVTVGGDATFAFDANGGSGPAYTDFNLSGADTPNDQELKPGSYSVSEGTLAGWDKTSATCSNGDDPSAITLAAGQTITCTFTNTKKPTLTVNKVLVPSNDTGKFNLQIDGSTAGTGGNVGNGGTTGAVFVTIGAHSVGETAMVGTNLSDYTSVISGDCNAQGNVSLAAGENKVCTITNTRKPKLKVHKVVINHGGNATTGDFAPYKVDGNEVVLDQSDFYTIGSHVVTELTNQNYTATFSGDCDADGNVSLAAGDDKTCVITNEEKPAKLIVHKVVINHGLSNDKTHFAPYKVDSAIVNLDEVNIFNSGSHTVTELTDSNYTATFSGDCDSNGNVTLIAGTTKECTITNEEKLAKVIVHKIVINHGLSNDASNFAPYKVGSTTVVLDTETVKDSGSYVVSEKTDSRYNASFTAGDCDSSGNITLVPGTTKSCTITNEEKPTHLTVIKTVVPANDSGKFNLQIDGVTKAANVGDNGTTGAVLVNSGDHTVAELAGTNTNLSDYTSVIGDDCAADGKITLQPGDSKTCTITNTKKGKITVKKVTVGGDGDFVFDGDVADTLSNGETKTVQVVPGTYHSTETVTTGWDLTSIVCNDDDSSGVIGTGIATFNVTAGEEVTCTFTNTKHGKIIIEKQTIPDGSNAEFSFTGDVSGNLKDGQTAEQEVSAGTYHSTEGSLSGWVLTDITCDDSNSSGVKATGITTFIVAPGETVKCTFTNNKPGAQIDVTPLTATNKIGDNHVITATVQVHNGNGTYVNAPDGTTVTFVIINTLGATATFVGGNTCNTTAGQCSITINSPTTGHVSVNASASPTVLGISIPVSTGTGGDNSADAQKTYVNARIKINPNQATNPVNAAHTFTVTVEQDLGNGFGFTGVNNALVDAVVTPAPGSLDKSDCNNGTDSNGQCSVIINSAAPGVFTAIARSQITVGGVVFKLQTNGQNGNSSPATKTYVAGKIIVVKQTNPDGDTTDFNFTASYDNDGFTLKDNQQNDSGFLAPGTGYSVDETVPTGWDKTSATCNDGSAISNIDLAAGETVTCTFTNTKRGHITIEKQTLPDGSNATFDFAGDINKTLSDNGTETKEVVPGNYSVTEAAKSGWDLTSIVCNDSNSNGSGSTANFVVAAGEDVKCTFTNTQRGHIIVDKVTVPSGDTQSFHFNTTGTGFSAFDLTDAAAPKDQEVKPGAYTVSEDAVSGWTQTSAICDQDETIGSLDVGPGETVTCVFTNTKLGKVTIIKNADPNDCQDFSFAMTGQSAFLLDDNAGVQDCLDTDRDQSKLINNLTPGNFTVTETQPNQFWKLDSVVCVNAQGAPVSTFVTSATGVTITLVAGGDITCTFNNSKLSPTRTQGFWKNHTSFTSSVLTGMVGGMPIGNPATSPTGKTITGAAQLFGAWFADIPKKSDGKTKRSDIDQARIQLLHQLVTAKLNCKAFGCQASIQTLISQADAAYSGSNKALILSLAGQLDAYNNSGDTIVIGNAGKATPKDSSGIATPIFWDVLP